MNHSLVLTVGRQPDSLCLHTFLTTYRRTCPDLQPFILEPCDLNKTSTNDYPLCCSFKQIHTEKRFLYNIIIQTFTFLGIQLLNLSYSNIRSCVTLVYKPVQSEGVCCHAVAGQCCHCCTLTLVQRRDSGWILCTRCCY